MYKLEVLQEDEVLRTIKHCDKSILESIAIICERTYLICTGSYIQSHITEYHS